MSTRIGNLRARAPLTRTEALEVLLGAGLLLWGIGELSIAAAKIAAGVLLFVGGLWGRRIF